LLGNLRLKLVALFFAAALWSVVAYTSNPTQSHNYRLTVSNVSQTLPNGLTLIGEPPMVSVTVIATEDNLSHFDQHDLSVTGNFSNVHVGHDQVPIRVDNSDPAVQVDAPNTVPVTVDQLANTNLNVTLQRVHSLPAGYHEQTNATTVTPSTVRVDGPKSKLNGITAVALVDLDTVNAPGVNQAYAVHILDAGGKELTGVRITPSTVTVKMVVEADAITIAKAVGWTLAGQPAAGFRVTNVQITPLQVQATGLQNTLGTFSLLATDPVDISNQKSDVIKTVTIRPPNGVEVSPKTASVHVFIGPAPGVSPTSSP
jgi:YbbR domain-containing protein